MRSSSVCINDDNSLTRLWHIALANAHRFELVLAIFMILRVRWQRHGDLSSDRPSPYTASIFFYESTAVGWCCRKLTGSLVPLLAPERSRLPRAFLQIVFSGGKHPISLALHRNSLFVLNAGGQVGGTDNVTGFMFFDGRLYPMPELTRALSADNTNPAQVGFSSDGEVLIVTEKDTGVIDTFNVDIDGAIDAAKHFQSSGQTPFGFAVHGPDLIVTEAFGGAPDASAASLYGLDRGGNLEVISPTVPTTETSACWVVVTGSGRFAYTANTGSGTISGYRLETDGALTLLNADGVTGTTGAGSSPADMTLSLDGRFLYCRNGNGTISAFRVSSNGSLTPLIGVSGLPLGTAGLAGR
jgi:6-phosphogluconolactonase